MVSPGGFYFYPQSMFKDKATEKLQTSIKSVIVTAIKTQAILSRLFIRNDIRYPQSTIKPLNALSARRNLDCGLPGVLTAPNGVIKSHAGFDVGHNYGKSLHCVWHIQAPVGMKVELIEDSFDVEGSST